MLFRAAGTGAGETGGGASGDGVAHFLLAGPDATLVRPATVEAGTSTTVNLAMSVGAANEVVTVEAATAQINYLQDGYGACIQPGPDSFNPFK